MESISERDKDETPIGKTVCEVVFLLAHLPYINSFTLQTLDDEEEEDDEDDNDDDDESESHDEEEEDETEMDVSQERSSPVL